jgi:hypothetical protein
MALLRRNKQSAPDRGFDVLPDIDPMNTPADRSGQHDGS